MLVFTRSFPTIRMAGKTFLHPGRQAVFSYDGKVAGYLGEIHPQVADNYSIGERTYVAVIDMPVVTEMASFDRKYTGIAKFPAVTRDISMTVRKEINVGQIEEIIEKKGGKLLESFRAVRYLRRRTDQARL